MPQPARWKDDPPCGHEVVRKYQTHYCTYIRVPRLLTLQMPAGRHAEEISAILALQAYELWFKVMNCDLQAALSGLDSGGPLSFEPAKLLNRCARIVRLLEQQTEVVDLALGRDAGARLALSDAGGEAPSRQFLRLIRLSRDLESRLGMWPQTDAPHARAGRDYLARFDGWEPRFRAALARLLEPDRAGPTYSEALRLEALLSLQTGVKAAWTPAGQAPKALAASEPISPDELMFIVVHQAFELWFKVILHELDAVRKALQADQADVTEASRRMRRLTRIQELLDEQILIPATMLPLDFLRFRAETRVKDGVTYERGLSPASGTESYQFREIEVLCGLKGNVAHAEFLEGHPQMHIRLITPEQLERMEQPSLPEAFEALLERRGVQSILEIYTPADAPNPHADLAELADLFLEFDQFFQLWRVHHLTMVQSMIGRKSGTGFLGPEYLKETAGMGMQGEDDRIFPTPQVRPRFFEKLWEARTRMGSGDA